ncbi:TetR family transcriptional regulator C-terminal domain-containing protein [Nonomuraea sp. NPDC049158]|uniref:TetR family transcriptional regulator C-terminal domain-containing protein n=1 Tax=Nonomuraea sp. NPDC049158 TaxID=3155649 RepID=UPI0033F56BF4
MPELVSLYAVLSVEAADPAHPAHAYFVDRYTHIRRDIRHAFEELHARGLVRPGTGIAGAESDLIALIDGLQVQWLLDPASVDGCPPPAAAQRDAPGRGPLTGRAPAEVVADRISPAVGTVEGLDERTCVLHTGADTVETLGVYLGLLDADWWCSA